MEETFRYIWGNIKINRTIKEGGSQEPEYPEKLIRETINNALAWWDRDSTTHRFPSTLVLADMPPEPQHLCISRLRQEEILP